MLNPGHTSTQTARVTDPDEFARRVASDLRGHTTAQYHQAYDYLNDLEAPTRDQLAYKGVLERQLRRIYG